MLQAEANENRVTLRNTGATLNQYVVSFCGFVEKKLWDQLAEKKK